MLYAACEFQEAGGREVLRMKVDEGCLVVMSGWMVAEQLILSPGTKYLAREILFFRRGQLAA
mgnify:CR=1 FL=1